MKKKLSLICAAMLTCGLSAVHAQNPGDSFTDRIINSGFEGETTSLGVSNTNEPEGWTLTRELGGWVNAQRLPNDEITLSPYEGSYYYEVWAGDVTSIDLHQTITNLPVGVYQISARVRNTNTTEMITNQHIYATFADNDYESSVMSKAAIGIEVENWEKLTTKLIFIDNEENEIRIGIKSTGTGKGSAGWFQVDDFQLIFQGALDDKELLEKQVALEKLEETRIYVEEYSNSDEMQELLGVLEELYSAFEETYYLDENIASVKEIEEEIDRLKEAVENAKKGLASYKELNSLLAECFILLDYGYPGEDDFSDVISAAQNIFDNSDTSLGTDYEKAIADLEAAKTVYYYSQVPAMNNPANYTFLVDGPSFWDPKCGLTYDELDSSNESRAIWSNIKSWTNASVGGGDYRTNHLGERPCWNSWSDNFTSMNVYQTLTGLKNGYYAVKCYAMTQSDCITDQHAYVKSNTGIAVSLTMTVDDGWNVPEGWEELTTEMIAVVDGKLDIGFTSTSGGGTKGWFCVTDFTLLYYGEGDISLTQILSTRVEEANNLKSKLKGDRKALEGALAIAKEVTTEEQIIAALDTINAGMDIVNASNAEYNKFTENELASAIEKAGTLTGSSEDIMNSIITRTQLYIDSDIATSVVMKDLYVPALTNYQSYVDVLPKAEETLATPPYGYIESTISGLESIMANQKTVLIENLAEKSTIDWYIQQLYNGISAINAGNFIQEAKAAGSNYDISGIIMNPDAAAEDGWIINKGTGNTNTGGGEHYSGDGNRRYFDSWNGTDGVLNYTAYQEINFLPNGTYTLKAAGRSSCKKEGAKMFVVAGDTIWKTIPAGTWFNPETEEIEDAWNTRGEIWEAAMDENPESEIAEANGGKGFGWNWIEIKSIQVKDHKLSIGMSTDSLITHVPFTGTWFSIVDFQLIMDEYDVNNNDDSFDWVTSIEETTTGEAAQLTIRVAGKKIIVTNANGETVNNFKVYNIAGTEVNPTAELNAGIYIVKADRQVAKVIIK